MFLTRDDSNVPLHVNCILRTERDFNSSTNEDLALLQIIFFLKDEDGTPHRFIVDFEPHEMIKLSEYYNDNLNGLVILKREELKIKEESRISYDWG